jgi:hypothetical protein
MNYIQGDPLKALNFFIKTLEEKKEIRGFLCKFFMHCWVKQYVFC